MRLLASFRQLARLAAFAAAVTLPLAARAQAPEARFAFVIGNDGYAGAPLPTAANDAGLVADALRTAGFDVTGARNLDQDTLRASYREFLDKVAAAGPDTVAAIYLSGYGLQEEGENFLVPVGARVARDTDVALNAVRISDLTRALAGVPGRAHLVMLDLAYDGPFARQGQPLAPGLAIVEADANSLIGFNTAPGTFSPKSSGDYGPYAQALAELLRLPGLPLNDVFARVRTRVAELTKGAQVPWSASRIDPAFALLAPAAGATGIPAADATDAMVRQMQAARTRPIRDFSEVDAYAAALDRDTISGYQEFLAAFPSSRYAKNVRGLVAARREALTWRSSVAANTPNAYWSYLRRYSRGPHAADARRRLTRLAAAFDPPPNFAPIDFAIAPPPPDEEVYFETPAPVYYDVGAPAFADPGFLPPPPPWWRLPPPPPRAVIIENEYYLPTPVERQPPPDWVRPPPHVVAPQEFYHAEREPGSQASIVPYVAIPAALAAGIAAGKLMGNRDARRSQQGGPPVPPPGGQPPRTPFMPPVTQPPRPVSQLGQPGRPGIPPAPDGLPTPGQPGLGQGGPTGRPAGGPPPNSLPGRPPLPQQPQGLPTPQQQQQQGLPQPVRPPGRPGAPNVVPTPGEPGQVGPSGRPTGGVPPNGLPGQPSQSQPRPSLQQPQGLPQQGRPPGGVGAPNALPTPNGHPPVPGAGIPGTPLGTHPPAPPAAPVPAVRQQPQVDQQRLQQQQLQQQRLQQQDQQRQLQLQRQQQEQQQRSQQQQQLQQQRQQQMQQQQQQQQMQRQQEQQHQQQMLQQQRQQQAQPPRPQPQPQQPPRPQPQQQPHPAPGGACGHPGAPPCPH